MTKKSSTLGLLLIRFFFGSLLFIQASSALAQLHEFAPTADWIEVTEPDYAAAWPGSGGATDSSWIVLLDQQVDVLPEGDDYYQHLVVKILNAVGVDEYSQINLAVDPTYQTLQIHRLQVVRNGTVIEQRPTARITELPEETDLQSRIYNGNYNINILLTDVRAGDIVEYSYTQRSRDLVFPGHYAGRFDTGWSIPVLLQKLRLRTPVERPLAYRISDDSAEARVQQRGEVNELAFEWQNRPALIVDSSTPGWYLPWPYLDVSDLRDWEGVSRIVDPLYQTPADIGAELAAVAAMLRNAADSPEELTLLALRYVQEEIRYTSISIGRGSHVPTAPATVLERRFGDCKDKSLLLVTLLNQLGIDAHVALVHSTSGRALDEALPSPYAFDHAIVRVQIGSAVYWLDPTQVPRFEPLDVSQPANFERALPLAIASTRLETIPPPASDTTSKNIEAVLDLSAGVEAEATLDITSSFGGELADLMRDALEQGNPEQRRADYESYTARYYPGARSVAPLVVSDDKERNILQIREQYRLESGFTGGEDGVLELTLHADEVYSYGEPLGAGARRMPLALEYPILVRQSIQVNLPEEWQIESGRLTIDNPAFRYSRELEYFEQKLLLRYGYEALADHVPVAAIARFEADRARAYDDMGYVLTYNNGATGGGNLAVAPLPLLAMLAALFLAGWGCISWGYRYDPEPKPAAADAPVGIRGWLVLPAIGMVISPIMFAYLAVAWIPLLEAEIWHSLPTIVNEGYGSLAQAVVGVFMCIATALTILNILAAVLFFTMRSSAPKLFIVTSWISLLFGNVFVWWIVAAGLDTETAPSSYMADSIRELLATTLWTFYMIKSQRVAATFSKRLLAKNRASNHEQ